MIRSLRLRKEALTELGPDALRAVAGGTEPSETICYTFDLRACLLDSRLCITSPAYGAAR